MTNFTHILHAFSMIILAIISGLKAFHRYGNRCYDDKSHFAWSIRNIYRMFVEMNCRGNVSHFHGVSSGFKIRFEFIYLKFFHLPVCFGMFCASFLTVVFLSMQLRSPFTCKLGGFPDFYLSKYT